MWKWDGFWQTYHLQVRNASIQQLLLLGGNLANLMDLLNTTWAQLDLASKELNTLVLVQWAIHEGWLNDALLSLRGSQQALRESRTSHRHGQGSRSSTILGLHDLITTELDTVEKLSVTNEIGVRRLREQRHDRHARVSTHDNNVLILRVGILDLAHEAGSTHDIESRNTEQTLGVVDSLGLEDLSDDWDGAVDWIRDDEDVGVWGRLSGCLCEVADDGGVGVEQVVAGHAWLAGNTSGNEHDFCTLKSCCQSAGCWVVAGDLALGVDVADVCCDTWNQKSVVVEAADKQKGVPGAMRISYSAKSVTRGFSLRRRDNGWPIPPAAPRTVTFDN